MCLRRAVASIRTRNSRRWIRRTFFLFAAELSWASRKLSRNDLDKGALMKILTEPKNALLKQYQRLFEFENVRLRFTDDALETVAELALQRKVGARGLRMILEDLMLELMYHLPMQRKVRDFVVTADMVRTREINWSLLEKAG